jgi:hypothetical protein
MKIYVGHASSFNYIDNLYQPLKDSDLWENYEFILPHESSQDSVRSKEIIESCEAFIAEVTYPSTGLGIELGWASTADCPIYCFAQNGSHPSSSINIICPKITWYEDQDSLVNNLREWLINGNYSHPASVNF